MDTGALPKRPVDQMCAEAKEDLVGLWEIARLVERETGPGELAREQTLAVVRALLARGLRAGDPPYSAGGYKPWANQVPAAVIERIRREWAVLGRTPNIPDIAWFELAS